MEEVEFKFDVSWRDNPFFCGLDVHKHELAVTICSAEYRAARIVSRSIFRVDDEGLERFWNYVNKYHPAGFAMEATGIYHHLIYKFLKRKIDAKPWTSELVVTNPADTNNLPGRQKNDKIDSEDLARYLALGMLKNSKPIIYVLEDIKRLYRRMLRLEKERTMLKNHITKVLDRAGIRAKGVNLNHEWFRRFLFHFVEFYGPLRAFMEDLQRDDHPLRPHRTIILKNRKRFEAYGNISLRGLERLLIRQDLIELELKTARKAIFTIEIGQIIEHYPHLREQAANLASIPGISKVTALWILSEIGNISHYPTPRKFSAYCGCCPRIVSSANKVYSAHISRHSNSHLRTIFYNAGVVICNLLKQDSDLKRYADRSLQRKGKRAFKLTVCCVATKLTKIVYAILRDGVPYNPSHLSKSKKGTSYHQSENFELVDKRLIRRAKKSLTRINETEREETLGMLKEEITTLVGNLDLLLRTEKN
jgi:transposase